MADPAFTRRWRITREGRLWIFAAVALWLCGALKGINLILLLAYLMLGMVILNGIAVRNALRRIRLRRRSRGAVFAGQPTDWEIEATNLGNRTETGWSLVDRTAGNDRRWPGWPLRPGKPVRFWADVTFSKRGRNPCLPMLATTSYPFGLIGVEVTVRDDAELIVFPQLGQLNVERLRRWLKHSGRPDERERRSRRRLQPAGDVHGLRPFRAGDSPRWIHWRTTARRGEVMVREFDHGARSDLAVMLDARVDPEHSQDFEDAVSLVATLTWRWAMGEGDRLSVAVGGVGGFARSGLGREPVSAIMKGLAEVQGDPSAVLTDLAQTARELDLPPGPVLLVVSRTVEPAEITALAARLDRPVTVIDARRPPPFYHPRVE